MRLHPAPLLCIQTWFHIAVKCLKMLQPKILLLLLLLLHPLLAHLLFQWSQSQIITSRFEC